MREGRTTQGEPEKSLIAGRYRVERPLAKGGMGAVFQVHDELTGSRLALKRMHENSKQALAQMFEREYVTLASLQHPRIVRVFDYGFDAGVPLYFGVWKGGRPYVFEAYMEGCRLKIDRGALERYSAVEHHNATCTFHSEREVQRFVDQSHVSAHSLSCD